MGARFYMRILTVAVTGMSLMMLVSCSEAPPKTEQKSTEAAKPPEPVTGLDALDQMFRSARGVLGGDVEIVELKSIHLAEVKDEPGKAGAWQCQLASPSAGKSRMFSYSVVESEGNLHKGVFSLQDEAWSATRGPKSFPISAAKKDSTTAYQTALTKAADYEKKNPGKTISFLLSRNQKAPSGVAWRVIWGESAGTSNFSVLVDASSGDYVQTLH
jgi:hypothetical protein